MNRELIAQVAHEVNRAYCLSTGDASHAPWADSDTAQQASIFAGVDMYTANHASTPEMAHAAWLEAKASAGWTHGKVKDVAAKKHPAMMPYEKLPAQQRSKDHIFRAVVLELLGIKAAQDAAAEANPAPAVKLAYVDASTMPIRYIGRRENHLDGAYGTRIQWTRGQTRMVPRAIGSLMLKHTDVYALGDPVIESGPQPTANRAPAIDKSQEEVQDALDQIANMDKVALKTFAKTMYNMDVVATQTLGDMRTTVTGLVHQFGLG